jgi:uncharacterized protein (DUF885 family)
LKLRRDLQARQGSGFRLQQFHDDLMKAGPVPWTLVRRHMLRDDSPAL